MSRPLGQPGAALLKPVSVPRAPSRLKSKTPLKASNPKRKAEAYARNFSGGVIGHDDFIRGLGCLVDGCGRLPIEAAHVRTRKAGGYGSSWREIVPVCKYHHRYSASCMEGRGQAFGQGNGVSLDALAEILVVADPGVSIGEQLAAWSRLEAYSEVERMAALQRGYDLTGNHIQPPSVAAEVA